MTLLKLLYSFHVISITYMLFFLTINVFFFAMKKLSHVSQPLLINEVLPSQK